MRVAASPEAMMTQATKTRRHWTGRHERAAPPGTALHRAHDLERQIPASCEEAAHRTEIQNRTHQPLRQK